MIKPIHLVLKSLAVSISILSQSTSAQQSMRGRVFTDKTNGYEITIPRKWVRLPTNVEEKWIIGYFKSKKEYVGSAKAGDSLMGHKPYMKIIIFDAKVIKKWVETYKDGDTTIKTIKHPYRDYKDYVRRNLRGGGYHYSQEDSGTVKKASVDKFEIKLEKLANDKMRYIGWVYKGQGVDFAVEFEVLESQYKKLRTQIMATLGSFKFIAATGGRSTKKEDAVLKRRHSSEEWKKLSAKERIGIRKEIDKAREKKMIARLPEGWTVTKSKHFLVLSHSSKRYTKRITDAAETFRTWLEKRYGKVTDEYAMKAVIRVCKNSEEYRSYHSGSSETGWNFMNREIVTYNDYSNVGMNSGSIFWDIYGFYMQDKAPELLFSTPIWLNSGLNSYVYSAVLKGRKLVFQRSVEEFVDFAELRRSAPKNIKTAREILNLDSVGPVGAATRKLHLGSQIATFFHFIEGPGKRLKFLRGKDFIVDYMQAVREVAKEFDMKEGLKIPGLREAATEEEEETRAARSSARWKEYAKHWKARRAEFLAALQKRLPTWTDDEWKKLEKAYAIYHNKKSR